MNLSTLGWRGALAAALPSSENTPARVIAVHRGAADIVCESGEARLVGRDAVDLAVGDWVAVEPGDPPRRLALLPRRGTLVRQAAGRATEAQVLAAHVDIALVVTAVGEDFNPRRLERYLALVLSGDVRPAIVLHKIDLEPGGQGRYLRQIEAVAPEVPVAATTTAWEGGLDELTGLLAPGGTAVLLGSSGVGKSSIVNRLLGSDQVATRPIRASDHHGRHTTTARHLHVLPGERGLLIDTPGVRELGLWDGRGLARAFSDIEELALGCAYRDCRHEGEPGCAIDDAVQAGELDPGRMDSWRRLRREADARELLRDPDRLKAHNRKWGRMMREVVEERKRRRR